MPELPEVEHLRRSLATDLVGASVEEASLLRVDIVRGRRPGHCIVAADLIEGSTVLGLERHGKQLAIVGTEGSGLVVRLGMSGQLRWMPDKASGLPRDHVHARWRLRDAHGRFRTLEFRDPRRFGGLFPFRSVDDLRSRLWSGLGPDAVLEPVESLSIALMEAGHGSQRAVKAMLLDQSIVAGVGNIYADEALFAAGIHPQHAARRLDAERWRRLVEALRHTLVASIEAGGSTLRDYVDAGGRRGSFQKTHQVYGRARLPCLRCGETLRSGPVASRTTVWCPNCQSRRPRRSGRPAHAHEPQSR